MPSVYEIVRDRIIKQLEAGVVPWKQTWTDLSPVNIMTFNEYRGINRILLAGHKYWGTLRQIEKTGGSVKEGEEASGTVSESQIQVKASADALYKSGISEYAAD